MKNNYILTLLCFFLFCFTAGTTINAQITGTLTDSDDGRTYKTIKIGSQWWMAENLNYATPEGSWCYNNDTAHCSKFGRLYDWETAKRICPRGWHLPTKAEFDVLIENIENGVNNAYELLIQNGSSGFNALLGGRLYAQDKFYDININGFYWTNTKDYLDNIWHLNLYSENNNAFFYFSKELTGLSVRCLKN